MLSSSLLAEDDPEIYIIMGIDHEPLAKVANKLALLGSVEVKVEPGLREKKITLELDVPLVEALEKVAAAAGAHLVRTGPKAFAIRSEPAAEGEAEEGERVPKWVRPLMKKLDATEVTFTWQGKPLGEILTWLSKESGVRIRLDPRLQSRRGRAHPHRRVRRVAQAEANDRIRRTRAGHGALLPDSQSGPRLAVRRDLGLEP